MSRLRILEMKSLVSEEKIIDALLFACKKSINKPFKNWLRECQKLLNQIKSLSLNNEKSFS